MEAEHIREIQYPDWLANVVMVKRPMGSGGWRHYLDSSQEVEIKDVPISNV